MLLKNREQLVDRILGHRCTWYADPEPHTVALATLARATGMDRALYPGWAGRGDRTRLARIGRDQPAGPEVACAVAALEP